MTPLQKTIVLVAHHHTQSSSAQQQSMIAVIPLQSSIAMLTVLSQRQVYRRHTAHDFHAAAEASMRGHEQWMIDGSVTHNIMNESRCSVGTVTVLRRYAGSRHQS